jgi:predicted acyl esterase
MNNTTATPKINKVQKKLTPKPTPELIERQKKMRDFFAKTRKFALEMHKKNPATTSAISVALLTPGGLVKKFMATTIAFFFASPKENKAIKNTSEHSKKKYNLKLQPKPEINTTINKNLQDRMQKVLSQLKKNVASFDTSKPSPKLNTLYEKFNKITATTNNNTKESTPEAVRKKSLQFND